MTHSKPIATEQHLLTRIGLGRAHTTIRVPELRNIAMTRKVQDVVDHVAFQRLRHVRQLGPTHLVYPGAVHTRFEHSLGVFGTAQWFLSKLLHNPSFAASVHAQDLRCILAAALLHDVGHYPFAHSLEALHLKGRTTPTHEHVGGRIILGHINTLHGEKTLGHILEQDWHVSAERVIAMCTGDFSKVDGPTQTDLLLRSIISGAIDADKMDYLERDSHHMGVPYGRHYDRQRLLDSLTLTEAEDAIAIDAKGKVSAEMFIFSRYTMFSEAYWHHTVRAVCAMVEGALSSFYDTHDMEPKDMLQILLERGDDRFLTWVSHNAHPNDQTHTLLDGMLGHRRKLHKRILTLSCMHLEDPKRDAYAKLYTMDRARIDELAHRLGLICANALGHSSTPIHLLIDTPPRDKDQLEAVHIVYPHAQQRHTYPLHEISRIVSGIQGDFMHVVKKIRVFAPFEYAQDLLQHQNLEALLLEEIMRAH